MDGERKSLEFKLEWSRWFRCESTFDLLLVPARGGVFALAEELLAMSDDDDPGDCDDTKARRMLAIFEISDANDLARTLSRLFASTSPWRERLVNARCYVRYAEVQDPEQRQAVCDALRTWMSNAADTASGFITPQSASAGDAKKDDQLIKPIFPAGF